MTKMFAPIVVVLAAWLPIVVSAADIVTLENVQEPAANRSDEPKAATFSLERAVHFLDSAALDWQKQRKCFTCHTNYAFMYARPAISADNDTHRTVRQYAARRLDVPLILAGEGDLTPSYGEQVGVVRAAQRAELMAGAVALMCPTIYVEPFGCVAVEAQLCGTPVISTDWGAFTETVEQGVGGYRCRTLGEFMWAAEELVSWDVVRRLGVQDRARERWSLETIGREYDVYFRRLETLKGDGWYDSSMRSPVGVLSGTT